jgi:hypothetical protein
VSLIVRRREDASLGSIESGSPGGRNTLGSSGHAASPVVVAPTTPRRWVTLAFQDAAPNPESGLERFRLEALAAVRGPRPVEWWSGMSVTRRESVAVRKPEPKVGSWSGLVDPAHSTSPEQIGQLLRAWEHNPFRVTLLLACRHVPRFWDLPERDFDHCGLPDEQGVRRVPILGKVVRHLQRAASNDSNGAWDTLAQFEMLPEHVAHVREYLAERREMATLSNLVERQVEVWMVKYLDGTDSVPTATNA